MSNNAHNRRNRPCLSRTVAGLVLVALAGACNSPTAPSRNGPAPGNRLEIVNATAVAPHQTSEVQAFLVGLNGARQDVTARVTWTTSDATVLSVSSDGRITGGAVGEATLRATLNDVSASTTVIVVPAGTFRLAGIVRGPGSASPISGAQVELITASGEVLTTQTTGAAGFRFYGVAGPARLRISRRTFRPYEAEIDLHDHLTHDALLSDFSGSYTLTLSASSRCASDFPQAARTRTFVASIAQVGSSLVVDVPMSNAEWRGAINKFTGEFSEANDVFFQLRIEDWFLTEPALSEFYARGSMTATIGAAGFSGLLNGEIAALVPTEGDGVRYVACSAPDHGAVFSR